MTRPAERLYELLPVIHRMRDAELGYPLRDLLSVIGEQVNAVEDNIAQLYANWFIETCEDWAVPYIGDLIGYRPVQEAGSSADLATVEGRMLGRRLVPRRELANTLAYRRRKGTLALLELLANDVADWPARAVEFYRLLGWTQHLNHLRPDRARTVDVRDGGSLDLVNSPFDPLSHSVDIRRVNSRRTLGRYNIPSVGVFAWRLKTYSVTHAPTYCVEGEGSNCFCASVLGNDTALYFKPEPEPAPSHIAGELNLPVPIRRRALQERNPAHPSETQASAVYYGAGKSIAIYAPGWFGCTDVQPIPQDKIIPADLSDWRYRAPAGHAALDPVLGRIVFPNKQLPKDGVWVDYRYAFSADMGGGEYRRQLSEPAEHTLFKVRKNSAAKDEFRTINAAYDAWRNKLDALQPQPADDDAALPEWLKQAGPLRAAIIEICDSAAYTERLKVELGKREYLQIRAANFARPVIRLLDNRAEGPDAFRISGKQGSRFVLDGIVVTGRGLKIEGPDWYEEPLAGGDLCDVIIRHSTLVPGWGLKCDCEPTHPREASVDMSGSSARLVIERSIIGSIIVNADEVQTDPVEILISDSIVDATGAGRAAISAAGPQLAFALVTLARCTIIGTVDTHAIKLAENSIFMGKVRVGRRQFGCMRYCYVSPGSRTPRRTRCQPDALNEMDAVRVRPRFTSLRYGNAAYCQLSLDCATEISGGADDESEMGAFHGLFQPQRAAVLRARLEEFTPAGMDAGLLFAN